MKPTQSPGEFILPMLLVGICLLSCPGRAERPVPPSRIFPDWQVEHFGDANSPMADPEADPDGDGLKNALECLLGGDPVNASNAPRPVLSSPEESHFVFTVDLAAAHGPPIRVSTSPNLQQWSPVASRSAQGGWQIDQGGVTVAVDESSGRVSITVPRVGSANRFVRIEVDSAPVAPSEDSVDSDGDGSSDWLEIYAESIPEWSDGDGDGISDSVEVLIGGDPDVDESAQRFESESAFSTALEVFQPVSNSSP